MHEHDHVNANPKARPPLAGLTKDSLQQLLREHGLDAIGSMIGRSAAAVHRCIKNLGITNPRGKHLAPPGARRVVSNGNISWKGTTAAVGRLHAGKHVFVEEIKGENKLVIFSDKDHARLIKTVRMPASRSWPVLEIHEEPAVVECFLRLDRAAFTRLLKRRHDGELIETLARETGVNHGVLERVFKNNNVKPKKASLVLLEEYINYHHPDARLESQHLTSVKDQVVFTCENGHRSTKTAATIMAGSWCGDCFAKQHFQREQAIRDVVERMFGMPFPRVRPAWLKSPGCRRLELDMFNENLKLAFEHNGIQHYQRHAFFHESQEAFLHQQRNDEWKQRTCKNEGIILITVPHDVSIENVDLFITSELNRLGVNADHVLTHADTGTIPARRK